MSALSPAASAAIERARRLVQAAEDIAHGNSPQEPLRPEDWAEKGFQDRLIAACQRREQHVEQMTVKALKFDGVLDIAAAIGTKRT